MLSRPTRTYVLFFVGSAGVAMSTLDVVFGRFHAGVAIALTPVIVLLLCCAVSAMRRQSIVVKQLGILLLSLIPMYLFLAVLAFGYPWAAVCLVIGVCSLLEHDWRMLTVAAGAAIGLVIHALFASGSSLGPGLDITSLGPVLGAASGLTFAALSYRHKREAGR